MPFRILGEPWKTLGGSFGGILGSGPRGQLGVDFLFRDDFLTDEAAPLTSPRTAEPGPGIGTIIDTTNAASISGNQFVVASSNAIGDPGVWYEQITRVAGICFYSKLTPDDNRGIHVGWDTNQAAGIEGNSIRLGAADQNIVLSDFGAAEPDVGDFTNGTEYELAVVLRSAGAFPLIKGGIFTEWTLLYALNTWGGNPFPGVSGRFAAGDYVVDTIRGSQLSSPWDTDFGIATDRLAGARTPVDPFTHEADCLIEFTVVGLGAATIVVIFRRQDALNYWQIDIINDGSFRLAETIAGVFNTRANTGAGVVGAGDRIVVIADDETIRGYVNNALLWTYALAANFKTETSGEYNNAGAGGSISDLITWPRTISGVARRALDRVANV